MRFRDDGESVKTKMDDLVWSTAVNVAINASYSGCVFELVFLNVKALRIRIFRRTFINVRTIHRVLAESQIGYPICLLHATSLLSNAREEGVALLLAVSRTVSHP